MEDLSGDEGVGVGGCEGGFEGGVWSEGELEEGEGWWVVVFGDCRY